MSISSWRDRPGRALRGALPAALALALAAIAALLVATAPSAPLVHDVQAGFLYLLLRFEQSLPLIGFGFALAAAPRRLLAACFVLIIVGIPLGSLAGAALAAAIEVNFSVIRFVFLIGPAYSALMGMVLIAPPALAAWTLPLAALASGAILGLGLGSFGFGGIDPGYAAGILLAGTILLLLPLLLLREFDGPWRAIAARIFGSWFIAIGFMLAGHEILRDAGP